MGVCFIHRPIGAFKAFIEVTATPNCSVTITLGTATQTQTADANGKTTFTVKKKGQYSVTSDAVGAQTYIVDVQVNKQTYEVNITGKFVLTLSTQSINGIVATTVGANRTSSPYAGAATGALANGAYIYYGDVLDCTCGVTDASTYNSATMTVNGTTQSSGYDHTVTSDVTVASTTSVKSYTLTISNQTINSRTSTSITVNRTSSAKQGASTGALANGATLYYGDVLTCSCAAADATVYNTPTMTINSTTKASGSTHTVTGAVTVAATTTVKSFTMTITNATINGKTAATISAKKTSSPYQGTGVNTTYTASTTVYYGDVFTCTVTNSNSTVYNAPSMTVAGTARSSGYSHTATAAFTIAASSSVKSFTITYSKGANTNLSLQRTESTYAGASLSTYTASFTGYYGDKIKVTASAATNYNLSSLKWGSTSISSGSTQTATGAVTVSSTATVQLGSFTCTYKEGTSSTVRTMNFSYPKTYTTFKQLCADSTYCWSTNTYNSGGDRKCRLLNDSTGTQKIIQIANAKTSDTGTLYMRHNVKTQGASGDTIYETTTITNGHAYWGQG